MSHKSTAHKPLDLSDPLDGNWDFAAEFFVPHNRAPGSPISAPNSATQSNIPRPAPVVLPTESTEAEAAVTGSGSGGVGSVVAQTSGGLTINLIFDAAAMAAPASFRAGIEQAAALLSTAISDKITLNINIDYSGTGGGAAAGPDNGQWVSYSTVRSDLVNNAAPGDTTFNALPLGSSIQGQSSLAVWNAQLKL
jgi:serralysin